MNLDPNKEYRFEYDIDLQSWDFCRTIRVEITGSHKGFQNIDFALSNFVEDLPFCGWQQDGDREDFKEMVLTTSNGDVLSVEIYDEDDLKELVTGVRLVRVSEYKQTAAPENATVSSNGTVGKVLAQGQ